MEREIPWYRASFGVRYMERYAHRGRSEAEDQVGFVLREVGRNRSDRALDLACGFGRHVIALGEHGIPTIGLDLSRELLSVAAETAGRRPLPIEFIQGDVRALPFRSCSIGLALSMFTSFGYFETDRENVRVLEEVSRVLTPRGKFFLDFLNREEVIRSLNPISRTTIGTCVVEERRSITSDGSRIEKRYEIIDREGRVLDSGKESVRLFSLANLTAMLNQVALEVERVYGDFQGHGFTPESPRLIILASSRN